MLSNRQIEQIRSVIFSTDQSPLAPLDPSVKESRYVADNFADGMLGEEVTEFDSHSSAEAGYELS